MRTANLCVAGLSLLISMSVFTAAASPSADTIITRTITTDRITKMKVVGNIYLVLIKSDTDKAEIKGPNKLVAGLTLPNKSQCLVLFETTADRPTPRRIKSIPLLRKTKIQTTKRAG